MPEAPVQHWHPGNRTHRTCTRGGDRRASSSVVAHGRDRSATASAVGCAPLPPRYQPLPLCTRAVGGKRPRRHQRCRGSTPSCAVPPRRSCSRYSAIPRPRRHTRRQAPPWSDAGNRVAGWPPCSAAGAVRRTLCAAIRNGETPLPTRRLLRGFLLARNGLLQPTDSREAAVQGPRVVDAPIPMAGGHGREGLHVPVEAANPLVPLWGGSQSRVILAYHWPWRDRISQVFGVPGLGFRPPGPTPGVSAGTIANGRSRLHVQ